MAQQKSGKKSKKAQRPVSCPLSPTRLTELKVLEASPPTQTGFDPGGGFSSAYDLWITYEGKTEHHWGAEDVQLHYFRQFGQGMLPYEYFLDDSHRLVLVVSGYRAYILKGGKNG